MIAWIERLSLMVGWPVEQLMLAGIGAGMLLGFAGLAVAAAGGGPAATRLAATRQERANPRRSDQGLLRAPTEDPKGIARSFVPTDLSQRLKLARDLAQAGFAGPRAVVRFQAIRVALGLLLPLLLVALMVVSRWPAVTLPLGLSDRLGSIGQLRSLQIAAGIAAVGYIGPAVWLRSRVAERRQRIEEGFPNALDLLQVSVEAGLGFDAAMTRVGNELAEVSPDIAWEFLSVQRQVAAGRPREAALADMATRTGVDTVRSFAHVVAQSMHFGTPMSEALTTYATEMRQYREMKAQEMANKLPVKMSAVLASLMLPALILITVGPVVIRYIRL